MNALPSLICCDHDRRKLVRAGPPNGIDYLEVERDGRVLNIYLFHEAPERVSVNNVQIHGGIRVPGIRVVDLRIGRAAGAVGDARLQVVVDRAGDLSTYTLHLVETDAHGVPTGQPLAEFDPFYASIAFTFHEGAVRVLDCKPRCVAPPSALDEPDINYLAKDYGSFRRLILDRLASTMPAWGETHVPDLGIALVEILAYVGDYLSYYQDAVATEAYLQTARKRVSVRRHLRLLDYRMHDGCNARTWIILTPDPAAGQAAFDPDSLFFLSDDGSLSKTELQGLAQGNLVSAAAGHFDAFEAVVPGPSHLYGAHQSIDFYCWGNSRCSLAAGSTSATLRDAWDQSDPPERVLHLQPGDFLCLEQHAGAAGADPTRRHFVRLTEVQTGVDALFDPPVPVVQIEWAKQDALPFQMILSTIGPPPDCAPTQGLCVARGNVVLADEGFRIVDESLGVVPVQGDSTACAGAGLTEFAPVTAGSYQPVLQQAGLIFTRGVALQAPASSLLVQDPVLALPWILVRSIPGRPDGSGPLFGFADLQDPNGPLITALGTPADTATWYLRTRLSADTRSQLSALKAGAPIPDALRAQMLSDLNGMVRQWKAKVDLLRSGSTDQDFVVEVDDDGLASLRFGDSNLGRAPEAGEAFSATYRILMNAPGHIGAESIKRTLRRPDGAVLGLPTPCNPVAAQGRVDPQSIDEARTIGPGSIDTGSERAVTADDYACLAQRYPGVQRAAATLLWTGSRFEARVAIDPLGADAIDKSLLEAIRIYLERYRRIGHDLIVVPATYVPIDLRVQADVIAGHSRAHVERALRDAFSNRSLPGGGKGFFHPDRLTFGQAIDAGQLMAAGQAVPGVQSVQVLRLERLFPDPGQQMQNAILALGPMEVARLDNDPSQPENGRLAIELKGGR